MARLIRFLLIAFIALPGFTSLGCGPSKDEAKPNPELKTPEVPPSSHGSKDQPKDKGKKP